MKFDRFPTFLGIWRTSGMDSGSFGIVSKTYAGKLLKTKIIKATIISLLVGALLLVIAVLPAEFRMDPTGAGELLGFNILYVPEEAKNNSLGIMAANPTAQTIKLEKAGSGPNVDRPVEADNHPPTTQLSSQENETKVIVSTGKEIEFKIDMLKYGKMKYEWTTSNGEILYFDFHSEVKQEKEVISKVTLLPMPTIW